MSFTITTALPLHLSALRSRLRTGDRMELTCMGLTPARALWLSYRASLVRRVALIDGQPIAAWGCAGVALGGVGEPWLLTAPEVERSPVRMVRAARGEVDLMLEIYPTLRNYVAAEYRQACRFLEVLGFQLGEPFALGPKRALFRHFTAGR